MKKYREEKNDSTIILWDDEKNIGLQFYKDEPLTADNCVALFGEGELRPEDVENYKEVATKIFHYAKSKYYNEHRERREGKEVTIWDDENGVGLRFTEGDTLQLYTSSLVIDEPEYYCQSEEGINALSAIKDRLTKYAAEKYPNEFRPLKED